jgi:hypothetical protein
MHVGQSRFARHIGFESHQVRLQRLEQVCSQAHAEADAAVLQGLLHGSRVTAKACHGLGTRTGRAKFFTGRLSVSLSVGAPVSLPPLRETLRRREEIFQLQGQSLNASAKS